MREWPNWKKAKNAAFIFSEAAKNLFTQFNHGMEYKIEEERSLIIPFAVLQIFSCELGLKSLLLKQEISFGHIHDLNELFGLLPEETKTNIKCKFTDDCDFDMELINISNMFINLRYYFEKTEDQNIPYDFINILNKSILDLLGYYE